MNNAVYCGRELIGYRCFTCGEIKQSMWGCKCNSCRAKAEDAEKLRNEIRQLRETIETLKLTK